MLKQSKIYRMDFQRWKDGGTAAEKIRSALRLIQTCVIRCIKRSRGGRFNTSVKQGQLENSLSYWVLHSLYERAISFVQCDKMGKFRHFGKMLNNFGKFQRVH